MSRNIETLQSALSVFRSVQHDLEGALHGLDQTRDTYDKLESLEQLIDSCSAVARGPRTSK